MKSFKTHHILTPASWIYSLIQEARNLMFDINILKGVSFGIPVICIGNLTVGGTGKTPMVQYLIEMLSGRYRVAVLSRGYGRKTKGFVLAGQGTQAWQIGDEPWQIHKRYPDIAVAVCEKRVRGIEQLISLCNPQVIILDDAFQHRYVRPSLSILLTDYHRLFTKDMVMPAGRLRENRRGAGRADIIVVTKTSLQEFSSSEEVAKELKGYGKPIFFSGILYQPPYTLYDMKPLRLTPNAPILLITGIANPQPLKEWLESEGHKVSSISFPDHHTYTQADLDKMQDKLAKMPEGTIPVTTEKDACRLSDCRHSILDKLAVIPIGTCIHGGSAGFDKHISQHLNNFYPNEYEKN